MLVANFLLFHFKYFWPIEFCSSSVFLSTWSVIKFGFIFILLNEKKSNSFDGNFIGKSNISSVRQAKIPSNKNKWHLVKQKLTAALWIIRFYTKPYHFKQPYIFFLVLTSHIHFAIAIRISIVLALRRLLPPSHKIE